MKDIIYDKSDLTLQLVQSELDLLTRLLANDQQCWFTRDLGLISKRSVSYDRISARKHALSRLSLLKLMFYQMNNHYQTLRF